MWIDHICFINKKPTDKIYSTRITERERTHRNLQTLRLNEIHNAENQYNLPQAALIYCFWSCLTVLSSTTLPFKQRQSETIRKTSKHSDIVMFLFLCLKVLTFNLMGCCFIYRPLRSPSPGALHSSKWLIKSNSFLILCCRCGCWANSRLCIETKLGK